MSGIRRLQPEEQDTTVAKNHQVGEPGMNAHADEDRLTLGAAGPSLGEFVGAVVDGRQPVVTRPGAHR